MVFVSLVVTRFGGLFGKGVGGEREHRECQPLCCEISPEGAWQSGWNGKVRQRPTMNGRTAHHTVDEARVASATPHPGSEH